jgi:hypothetical protein
MSFLHQLVVPVAIIVLALTCESDSSPAPVQCDLYIAESTIPHAGLGIFTAVEKKVGDSVGEGDVCIPIFEAENQIFPHDPFSDFVWNGGSKGMGFETMGIDVINALWPGLDCAVNCNIPLTNVKASYPKYDGVGLHRSKDPGAGAVSPYRYRKGKANVIRDIPAGGELFKFYGDHWFEDRDFTGLPLSPDFQRAEDLLQGFSRLGARKEIHEEMYRAALDIRGIWNNSRTLNALPRTYEDAQRAQVEDIAILHQPNATRSLEWLQEHGKCIDNIISGPSTIKGAGDGAFAKRYLPQGTIITGSPLIHVPFRNYTDVRYYFQEVEDDFQEDEDDFQEDEDDFQEDEDDQDENTQFGQQVLLNYCFGNPLTTLLLFPYGSGINYINHNQTLANVKIQWSADGTSAQDDSFFNLDPEQLGWVERPGLSFDYIATMDIQEGGELFLDYGDSWEHAWHEHVRNWDPSHVLTFVYWNKLTEPIRTEDEEANDPYPDNVQLRCHCNLLYSDWQQRELDWSRTSDDKPEEGYQAIYPQAGYQNIYGQPCRILDRQDETKTYTVEMDVDEELNYYTIPDDFDENETSRIRSQVPREAIFFAGQPYSSDLHLPNMFRHELIIPDHMIPDAWKNNDMKLIGRTEGKFEAPGVCQEASLRFLFL